MHFHSLLIKSKSVSVLSKASLSFLCERVRILRFYGNYISQSKCVKLAIICWCSRIFFNNISWCSIKLFWYYMLMFRKIYFYNICWSSVKDILNQHWWCSEKDENANCVAVNQYLRWTQYTIIIRFSKVQLSFVLSILKTSPPVNFM